MKQYDENNPGRTDAEDLSKSVYENTWNKFTYNLEGNILQFLPEDWQMSEGQRAGVSRIIECIKELEEGTVTVIAAPPGLGKSTIIPPLSATAITLAEMPLPIVICTDRLERLKSYEQSEAFEKSGYYFVCDRTKKGRSLKEKAVNLSDHTDPILENMMKMQYSPVVLLSTQKFSLMTEEARVHLMTYRENGNTYQRKLFIIDEAVPVFEVAELTLGTVSYMKAVLEDLADGLEQQDYVQSTFTGLEKEIYDMFTKTDQEFVQKYIVLPIKLERTSLSDHDEILKSILKERGEDIFSSMPGFSKNLEVLQTFLRDGGIYYCAKQNNGETDKNIRKILVPMNNAKKYHIPGTRTLILDGTGDVDWNYRQESEFSVVRMDEYKRSFSNLKITIVDANSSKTKMADKAYREQLIRGALKDAEKKNGTLAFLIITYKKTEADVRKIAEEMGINQEHITHWGDVTGKNDWRTLQGACFIGIHRKKAIDYLMDAIASDSAIRKEFMSYLSKTHEERSQLIDAVNALSAGHESELLPELQKTAGEILIRSTIVDLEQAVYRTDLRNYDSNKPVHVCIYCTLDLKGAYDSLLKKLKERFPGADIKAESCSFVKKQNRKNPTAVEKVKEYLEKIPTGTEFILKDLIEGAGITRENFRNVKKDPDILSYLEKWKMPGRNRYKKP